MPVRLAPLTLDHARVIGGWAADPVFVAHAGWTPDLSLESYVSFQERLVHTPPADSHRLAVLCSEDCVGTVDLHGLDKDRRELGYVIGPSSRWGQGLGTAAARAGLAHGFRGLGLEEIWAEAVEPNRASVAILERLGMRRTGLGGEENFLGERARFVQYAITRDEWEATRTAR